MSLARRTPQVRPNHSQKPVRASLFIAVAALVLTTPMFAGQFPETIDYATRIVDAEGHPVAGTHDLTLTYFGKEGDPLFAETLDGVRVAGGRLEIVLGTGNPAQARYDSLAAVFAEHPEVELELAVAGKRYSPRVGILPKGHSLKSRLVAAGLRAAEDDDLHWKHYDEAGGATAVQSGELSPADAYVAPFKPDSATFRSRPYTLPVVGPKLSRPVRELAVAVQQPMQKEREINKPRHETLFDAEGNRFGTAAPRQDDALVAAGQAPTRMTPALNFQFEGINNVNGVLPPDTEGAVGPNHYIQVVNLAFAIYNKSGLLLSGPVNTNTLWAGFGGPCQTDNSGDAIFLYDEEADRFVLTQFAVGGSNQSVCWAVSQTSDPTGAYYLYEVVTPRFPDYYKVGVWPDPANNAYFFGTNSGFQGQYDVFAVDRANMLAGATARPMQFFQNFVNLMMPADVDGYNFTGGPPNGSPGIFYTFRDGGESYFSSPPSDSIDVWEYDVDWTTPANSTFTLVQSITPTSLPVGLANFNWTVCGFFVSNCIPQPGTSQGIDSASWWPMQRLVYRNFGTHETLVGTWTVDVLAAGNRAAPRWFELRDSGGGWSIHQQGTHSPDAIHRFMPSIAMDNSGNIAIGYSRGDGSNFASIYYATRESTDALGTLQAEALMFAATGSQTSTSSRWGDYSSMELDPADDCTFWYTTEYIATTGNAPWRTRVGNFTIPGCGGPPTPTFSLACSPSSYTLQQGANDTSTCTVTAANGYTGTVNLSCNGNPGGIGCSFAPSSFVFTADGPQNSTLTLSVGGGQATGTFGFDAEATDGTITKTSPLSVNVIPAGSNGPQVAVFDSGLGVPKCAIAGSECDSTTLLDSRDNIGPNEPNQPNTLDACADGTLGSYHSDESNDRIVVKTLDGGNFTEGDTVEIQATVWAWSTGAADDLDLYYAADATAPSWQYIGSITPSSGGAQTLTAQYVLPVGSMQAVRARFRYQGAPAACATGNYDDHDDLVFAVEAPGGGCVIDDDCSDGLYCNGAEVCNAGTCEAGAPPVCEDGLFCNGTETCNETTDSCDAGTPPACDNGQFCDGTETCNETTDSCDAGTPPACDNGQFCDGAETCNETTDSCDAGTPPVTDDGVACTDDSCDEVNDVVVNTANNANCDNGLFCDGAETCDAVLDCQAGSDPCPGQSCDEAADQCVACIVDADCSDDLFCNGAEVCNAGVCEGGTPPVVDDGVGCTDDSCDEVNDAIVNAVNDANCDNGQFCDGAETCDAVLDCQAGTAPSTDDGVGCTDDSCDEVNNVIVNTPNNANCDNGQFCDGAETCDAVLDCQAGSDPCPGQTCDEVGDICVGGGNPVIWMSFRSNTAVPGVGTVRDEDIVSYDELTGQWALEFDGSDVGLGGLEIDGLAQLAGGDLLLSFTAAGTVGGLSVDDSDIVRFTGTLGNNTSGSFSFYFDGSDVGLSSNGEDIDGIALAADGRLIISTNGSMSASGASGRDEDLFIFTGTVGSSSTSGSFSQYFDGSDVGLNNSGGEDVDAAAFTGGNLLFSTVGNFAVSGVSGQDEDVVEFDGNFGSSTSGSFSMRLDLSSLGIASGEDVGSVHVVE